jgi:Bacterial dnaA protein helix-turn-helix
MTFLSEIHIRSQRFHAEIARRASLVPHKEVRTYFIPNTPFGTPKIKPVPPRVGKIDFMALFYPSMWFYELVNCPPPSKGKRALSVLDIQRAVANHFEISLTEMLADRRTQPLTRIRQMAMYLSKTLTVRSLPEIGRRFGGRDHTTVLHAVSRVERFIAEDEAFAAHVAEIKAKLSA